MANFTTEDLLMYMYNDQMSELEKAALEAELQSNWALREKLSVLLEAKKRLDNLALQSPRNKTVDAIMQYAMNPAEIHS